MRSHAGIASTMFQTLAAEGINILMISTSEIKFRWLLMKNIWNWQSERYTQHLNLEQGIEGNLFCCFIS